MISALQRGGGRGGREPMTRNALMTEVIIHGGVLSLFQEKVLNGGLIGPQNDIMAHQSSSFHGDR